MLKLLRLSTLFFFLFHSSLIAAPALPVTGSVSFGASPDRVGIVAALRGNVKIETPAQVGREGKSGMPVYLGDVVSTDAQSNLQILLLDQTVFTIGPNSSIIIDKFVYDPSSQDGQVNAKVVKGVFRFVTGKIGHKNPESVNIDLPAGTIGIRGTMAAGQVTGSRSLVVLLGPGERNNTGSRQGRLTVGNQVNGKTQTVIINRAGYGTVIESAEGAPTRAFLVPAETLNQLTNSLGTPPAGNNQEGGDDGSGTNSGGESPTEQAGQDTAAAGDSVEDMNVTSDLLSDLGDESGKAAQENAEEHDDLFNALSKFKDLSQIQLASATYSETGVPLYNSQNLGAQIGQYDISFKVNFQSETVGGAGSTISGHINGAGNTFIFDLGTEHFGAPDDFAIFFYDTDAQGNNNATLNGASTCMTCTLDAAIIFTNADGISGHSIIHSVEVGGVAPDGIGVGVAERP